MPLYSSRIFKRREEMNMNYSKDNDGEIWCSFQSMQIQGEVLYILLCLCLHLMFYYKFWQLLNIIDFKSSSYESSSDFGGELEDSDGKFKLMMLIMSFIY